jgi:hypothetical protein
MNSELRVEILGPTKGLDPTGTGSDPQYGRRESDAIFFSTGNFARYTKYFSMILLLCLIKNLFACFLLVCYTAKWGGGVRLKALRFRFILWELSKFLCFRQLPITVFRGLGSSHSIP